mmetsp:Transcript_47717/g.110599  ORF Transcript_47717/g.110599 Transcript_47717/m.110599 type:complete len:338 (-) Transcript_47717:695-1708(-)
MQQCDGWHRRGSCGAADWPLALDRLADHRGLREAERGDAGARRAPPRDHVCRRDGPHLQPHRALPARARRRGLAAAARRDAAALRHPLRDFGQVAGRAAAAGGAQDGLLPSDRRSARAAGGLLLRADSRGAACPVRRLHLQRNDRARQGRAAPRRGGEASGRTQPAQAYDQRRAAHDLGARALGAVPCVWRERALCQAVDALPALLRLLRSAARRAARGALFHFRWLPPTGLRARWLPALPAAAAPARLCAGASAHRHRRRHGRGGAGRGRRVLQGSTRGRGRRARHLRGDACRASGLALDRRLGARSRTAAASAACRLRIARAAGCHRAGKRGGRA